MADEIRWTEHRCDPGCAERRAAQRRGEFMYDFKRKGWIDPTTYWQARCPVVHVECPWCQGLLPDEMSAFRKLLDNEEC